MVGFAIMPTIDPDYHKKYYQKNKERLLEYQRKYDKEHLGKRRHSPEYLKEYREKNGDRIRKRARIMAKLKRSGLLQFLPKWRIKQIVEAKMNESH